MFKNLRFEFYPTPEISLSASTEWGLKELIKMFLEENHAFHGKVDVPYPLAHQRKTVYSLTPTINQPQP